MQCALSFARTYAHTIHICVALACVLTKRLLTVYSRVQRNYHTIITLFLLMSLLTHIKTIIPCNCFIHFVPMFRCRQLLERVDVVEEGLRAATWRLYFATTGKRQGWTVSLEIRFCFSEGQKKQIITFYQQVV